MADQFTFTYDDFMNQLWNKDPFDIDPSSFEILSTIRYDPTLGEKVPQEVGDVTKAHFFLLPEHVERLKFSLLFFDEALEASGFDYDHGFSVEEDYIFERLTQALEESKISLGEPLKVRFLVSMQGNVRIELYKVPERKDLLDGLTDEYPESDTYDLYVRTTPVLATPFTSFKTTKREVYTEARGILPGKSAKEEVLLVNTSGEVTEGSITNIAIKSGKGEWVTPRLTSGCLCGVTRHFLLRKNMIKEGDISLQSLKVGQDVLLFNGILGAVRGTIREIVQ